MANDIQDDLQVEEEEEEQVNELDEYDLRPED